MSDRNHMFEVWEPGVGWLPYACPPPYPTLWLAARPMRAKPITFPPTPIERKALNYLLWLMAAALLWSLIAGVLQ